MFNSWLPESQDRRPLTWWKQHPVYLAAIVALVGGASMVITAVLGYGLMSHLVFTFDNAFSQFHLWTPLTYVLFNAPSLWTVFGCYLLWNFGEAVERPLGRRAFVRLLLLLLASSPLFISLAHLAGIRGMCCAGMMQLELGVFIAFATLYPRVKISSIILTLDAWGMAAIFVGINALQCVAARDWVSLLLLAANVGTACAFIRYETGELMLPSLPKPSPKAKKPAKSAGPTVDDILDKISHQGMQSLTAEEHRAPAPTSAGSLGRHAAAEVPREVDLPRRDRAGIQDPRRLRRREGSREVRAVLPRGAGVSGAHFSKSWPWSHSSPLGQTENLRDSLSGRRLHLG